MSCELGPRIGLEQEDEMWSPRFACPAVATTGQIFKAYSHKKKSFGDIELVKDALEVLFPTRLLTSEDECKWF